ncbi:putative Ig domain-containing protein, partial [Spirosoma soli]
MRQLFRIASLGIVAVCGLVLSVRAQVNPPNVVVSSRAPATRSLSTASRIQRTVDSLQRLTQPEYYKALFTAKKSPARSPGARLQADVCNTYLCTIPATPLSVSLTSSGPLTCTVTSATLTATSNPVTGGTYTFAGPDGPVSSSGNTALVTQAGNYTVTFSKPGSQSATATATVTDSRALTATISGALTVCAGGTTSLTASGGNTFLWSNQATTATVSVTAGVYSVTVTTGSCQAVASATVSTTQCAPTNTAPVATVNASQTATVGRAFSYTVNAFTDAETPNSLTYSALLNPANLGLSFDPATRVISGTPSQPGPVSVTVTATDSGSLSASTSFSITVNPAPVVVTPLALTLTASPQTLLTTGTTTLSATVSGGTSPYGYSFTGPGSLTANGNTAQVASLTAGVQTFTVVVTDASTPVNQTATATVSVSVTSPPPVNTAPVATTNASQTAIVGQAFAYTVNAFSDAETPNSLTYSASISPANGLSFNAATRTISGTPSLTGVSTVTVTATDSGSLSVSTSFSITVNPAPVVVTPLALTLSASPTMVLTTGITTLSATVSGGTFPYRYTFSGPGTITQNITSNTASVSALSAGVQTFTVVVSDASTPASQTSTATVSVTVTEANTAPTVANAVPPP